MSVNKNSKYYEGYYDHVLGKKSSTGSTAKVFNIIADLSDRRGLRQEWENIDGDIQDEIIENWMNIIDGCVNKSCKCDNKK
jgi:hypothetical protein